jgi:hypothetical protein
MAGTFALFEHYPIVHVNGRELSQTQSGDTCQLYGSVAYGLNRREYQGEWEEVRVIQAAGTVIVPCYVPSAAVNLHDER